MSGNRQPATYRLAPVGLVERLPPISRCDISFGGMRFTDFDWTHWRAREDATLVFVVQDDAVLLIHKKRGLGAGKINGVGGRVHTGESPRDAAIREVQEELRITPTGVEPRGEVWFHDLDGPAIRIHLFTARGMTGEPQETEEAAPIWASRDALPFDRMWSDDRYWLPHVLAGDEVLVRTLFKGDRLVGYDMMVKPRGE